MGKAEDAYNESVRKIDECTKKLESPQTGGPSVSPKVAHDMAKAQDVRQRGVKTYQGRQKGRVFEAESKKDK